MVDQRAERPAFGALLRRHRLASGLSQAALAEAARISVQAVSALERGARSAPRTETLALLVEALALRDDARGEFETLARTSAKIKVRVEQPLQRLAAGSATRQMPQFLTTFFGRTEERRELEQIVVPGNCVTIWGTGGVGKTRLARETIDAVSESFQGDVVFVSLAETIDDDGVEEALAQALGLAQRPNQDRLLQATEALRDRKILIVMDNCEHVLRGAARVVEAIQSQIPGAAILCTSREILRLDREQVFPVEALAPSDAVNLFLDRAADPHKGARAPSELRSIDAICRRLDGLPLALELAAACTRAFDVAHIERALDERFALLTRGNRAVAPRHVNLRATIAWSYDLLETGERLALERIALINGRFTFEDAIAIAVADDEREATAIAAIAALVDKALLAVEVVPAGGARRYRVLESTRAFVAQLPRESARDRDPGAARRRFGDYLLERLRTANNAYRSGDPALLNGLELDGIRGFLHWAIDERHDPARGANVAGLSYMVADVRGLYAEGLRWIESALAILPPDATDPQPEIRAQIGLARLKQRLSQQHDAIAPAQRAFDLADRAGHTELRAAAAYLLAISLSVGYELEAAHSHITSALATYELLGDRHGVANALCVAGQIGFRMERNEEARSMMHRSFDAFSRLGNRRYAALALVDLAEQEYRLGNVELAIAHAGTGIAMLREHGTALGLALVLLNSGAYHVDAGRYDEAGLEAREALHIAVRDHHAHLVPFAIQIVAIIALNRGTARGEQLELYGYVLAKLEAHAIEFGFTERSTSDRFRSLLDGSLPDDTLSSAIARGRALDDETAVARALSLEVEFAAHAGGEHVTRS